MIKIFFFSCVQSAGLFVKSVRIPTRFSPGKSTRSPGVTNAGRAFIKFVGTKRRIVLDVNGFQPGMQVKIKLFFG